MRLYFACLLAVLFAGCKSASVTSPERCSAKEIDQCCRIFFVDVPKLPETPEEIGAECLEQVKSANCSEEVAEKCITNKQQRSLYTLSTYMKEKAIKQYCNPDSDAYKEYVKHAPCLNRAAPALQKCMKWNLNAFDYVANKVSAKSQIDTLCCNYPEFLKCYIEAVSPVCGPETVEYVERMSTRSTYAIYTYACDKTPEQSCQNAAKIPSANDYDESSPVARPASATLKLIGNLFKQ